MLTTLSCKSRFQQLSRGEKDNIRIVRRAWFLRTELKECAARRGSIPGWCRCHADGKLCKHEVPVLHSPADVPLAKGHLQADHDQFTTRPFPPALLVKTGKRHCTQPTSSAPSGLGKQEPYTFITQKGTLVRGENITHSRKTSLISYPTTALFQGDGWLKPNKVTFRDKPLSSWLFIIYGNHDPTGLSSSCWNMRVVLMKPAMLLMFKCSWLAACLYNNSALLPLTTEVFCRRRCHTVEAVTGPVTQKERGACCEPGSNSTGFSPASWSFFHSKY